LLFASEGEEAVVLDAAAFAGSDFVSDLVSGADSVRFEVGEQPLFLKSVQ